VWNANVQQEIATVNLGKFRKLQHELEEAETRAMLAEKSLSQLRAMSRQSTTSVTESVSVRRCTDDVSLPRILLRTWRVWIVEHAQHRSFPYGLSPEATEKQIASFVIQSVVLCTCRRV